MEAGQELLLDSPPYFDKDQWTDKPRFFRDQNNPENSVSTTTKKSLIRWKWMVETV